MNLASPCPARAFDLARGSGSPLATPTRPRPPPDPDPDHEPELVDGTAGDGTGGWGEDSADQVEQDLAEIDAEIDAQVRAELAAIAPRPYDLTPTPIAGDTSDPVVERILELNATAAAFYAGHYRGSWAADQLRDRLGDDLADHPQFTPGYAPAGWRPLTDHLRGLGATDHEIVTAGLGVYAAGTSRVLDRFRDRLILPIRSDDGIVAFIARRHPDRSEDAGPAIGELHDRDWNQAIGADGKPDAQAQVVDLTGILRHGPQERGGDRMDGWPADQRVIARRIPRAAGDQAKLGEDPNWRYGAFTRNTQAGQIQWLDARHRTQAHIEDKMKEIKTCGAENLPSKDWDRNSAWLQLAALATSLNAWLRHISLDGDLAKAEPKALRYRLFGAPARHGVHARTTTLKIPPRWAWADDVVNAFTRQQALHPA